jgi:hypothetical protein
MTSPCLIIKVSLLTLFNLDLATIGSILVKDSLVSPRHFSSFMNLYLALNSSSKKSLQYRSIAFLSKTIKRVFSFVLTVKGYLNCFGSRMYCSYPKISPDPIEQNRSWSSPSYLVFFLVDATQEPSLICVADSLPSF